MSQTKSDILPALFLRKKTQRRNAGILQIQTPNRIVESQYVTIGGIDQWVTIRGEDVRNPIVLIVHGGPASTYTVFTPLLRSWEKHFTVVQWDQRGAGKTFGRNGKDGSGTITFDRLTQDGIELAEYISGKLRQQKVILIGSSVGSLTGLMMAKQRPDLFHAYVGTDQNAPDPNQLVHPLILQALRTSGDSRGGRLIEMMGPDRSKWSRKDFEKRNQCLVNAVKDVPHMIMDLFLPSMLSSPEHTVKDIIDIFKGMRFSLDHLFKELVNFNFHKIGAEFKLPFFVFHGDKDIVTPTVAAKLYYDEIEAPYKEFVLIMDAGHLAAFARPEQFLEELVVRVRPLAVGDNRRDT
ncbi:MAG: proline iminopeptidase [Paenibacillus sp.]|nr:proline iminopeptidase [Paenibacillus sp.]